MDDDALSSGLDEIKEHSGGLLVVISTPYGVHRIINQQIALRINDKPKAIQESSHEDDDDAQSHSVNSIQDLHCFTSSLIYSGRPSMCR